jgi:hypothetical protein
VAMSISLFEAKSKFFVSSNIPANCPNPNQKKLFIFKMEKNKKKEARNQTSRLFFLLLDKFNLKKLHLVQGQLQNTCFWQMDN